MEHTGLTDTNLCDADDDQLSNYISVAKEFNSRLPAGLLQITVGHPTITDQILAMSDEIATLTPRLQIIMFP